MALVLRIIIKGPNLNDSLNGNACGYHRIIVGCSYRCRLSDANHYLTVRSVDAGCCDGG
jgi:hypothetical protein